MYCRKRYKNNNYAGSGGRGGLVLLCCPVSKRLQKRRPKDQGFGKKTPRATKIIDRITKTTAGTMGNELTVSSTRLQKAGMYCCRNLRYYTGKSGGRQKGGAVGADRGGREISVFDFLFYPEIKEN